jgi:glucose-1-phosphate thymidylyltransferase
VRNVKALVLSGGKGTRLRPLTFTLAKQLIPLANKPVLGYVLDQIQKTGIINIGIIIAPETGIYVKEYIQDGKKWGFNTTFIYQEPLGLAHAVKTAETFLGKDSFIMCLGDNLQGVGLSNYLQKFKKEKMDALILLKTVDDPKKFGVVTLDDNKRIINLEEKPKEPKSNFAIVGTYIFSNNIFKAINQIKSSWRGELEITDAIQKMISMGFTVRAEVIDTWWIDTGKKDDILAANAKVLDEYVIKEIKGTIQDSKIQGKVSIHESSRIFKSIIKGPCIIGENCLIENSIIGPYTSIGNETKIINSKIDNSIILDGAIIRGIDKLSESLIGKQANISKNHNYESLKLHIGDYSEVEI